MFTAVGVPPDASLMLMVVAQWLKIMVAGAAAMFIVRYRLQMHLRLSPGEQYRRTIEAGGYTP